ncbi:MAG TPA: cellulase family glycosylhydrolase [Candidatus Saccharimonadales bacterium]|nr:cellulase family glycosylhydrolase [Candidatus Saccharimonadales bacterium]
MSFSKQKKYYIIIFVFLFLTILLGFHRNYTIADSSRNLLYGSNIDMSQLLPTSPYYIKNSQGEDLIDIAHRLGINTLRISSVLRSFPYQTPDVIYTKAEWDKVLFKMANYNMKAIVIAETYSTNPNVYSEELTDDYFQVFKKYIIDSYMGDDPAVYAIDIKNEPTLDAHNLAMLQQVRTLVKQKYPWMKVTIGGWKVNTGTVDSQGKPAYRWNDPFDAQQVSGLVDFYSPHLYGFDRAVHTSVSTASAMVTNYLNAIETVANNKPILFSEFGAANGESISDQQTTGSKELQADTYYAMFNTLLTYPKTNILGSVGYVLYSRNQYPDAWAIMKNKGDYIYPAGYVLQQFASGSAQVSIPYPSFPDNYTLATTSAATVSAKVNDVITFNLDQPKTNVYKLNITPTGAADIVQDFQYNSQFNKFFAIFRVKTTGTMHISVDQIPPPISIYTTSITAK